jgi:TPR repeat protein
VSRSRRLPPHELDDLYTRADQAEDAKDYKLAGRLFRIGAKHGDTAAMYRLGSIYHSGLGVRQDRALGRSWELRAARKGDSTGAYNLGISYRIEQRFDHALVWMKKALQMGDQGANFEIGMLLLQMSKPDEAIPYLKAFLKLRPPCGAIDEEWLDAHWILRKLRAIHMDARFWRYDQRDQLFDRAHQHWEKGNIKTAIRLYRESAKRGQWLAQWYVGNFYASGNGVRKSPAKARYWFRREYRLVNSPEVARAIADTYRSENKIPQAIIWLNRAGAFLEIAKTYLDRGNRTAAVRNLKKVFPAERKEAEELLQQLAVNRPWPIKTLV